jgi:hypothetical protein
LQPQVLSEPTHRCYLSSNTFRDYYRRRSPTNPPCVARHRGPGCASPQIVVKETVNSLPYGSWIRTLFVGEPPAPDEHINFGLAQQDQDAAQPLSPTRSAPGHPSRRC